MQNPILLLIALSLNKLLFSVVGSAHFSPAACWQDPYTRLSYSSCVTPPHSPLCPVYFCALSNMFEFSNDYNCIGPVTDRGTTTRLTRNLTWFFIFLACVFHVAAFWDLFQLVVVVVYCVCVLLSLGRKRICPTLLSELTTCHSYSHITSDPSTFLPLCLKLTINCSEKLRMRPNIIEKLHILFALWLWSRCYCW